MTQLVRRDPFRMEPFFREFGDIARRFNRVFDLEPEGGEMFSGWYPVVDIFDKGNELVLQAELAGVKKEEIDIRVENNVLLLHGERKREHEMKEEQYYRSERSYGAFTRSFTLPATVDPKKIEASFKDGILTVRMPKVEEAKPRHIDVKVS